MEIERHPSPWPCVAMLVGLLLFCLMVPGLWKRIAPDESRFVDNPDVTVGVANQFPNLNLGGLDSSGMPALSLPYCDPLNLWTPTIEELIARRTATLGSLMGDTPQWQVGWPSLLQPSTNSETFDALEPDPIIVAVVTHVGRAIGEYSLADAISPLLIKAANLYPVSADGDAARSHTASRSTLRLTGPNDRLAMAAPATSPIHSQHSAAGCWCVPEVLFRQLEQLSGYPETSEWARRVLVQLHALTDRDEFKGDDVHAVLADLNGLTMEAVRLSDEFTDDRLRVELLRAHWALARRLDCWSAVYEMRLAARGQGRLAARGTLSQMIDDTSGVPHPDSNPDCFVAITNDIETYERTRDPKLGRQIAQEQRALTTSVNSIDRSLAEAMEQHYRNANVRVAITAEMLNRVLGEKRSEYRPVRERLAGASVRGQSNITTESRVLLDPTDGEWQFEIDTDGTVESRTLADGGPARLRSHGNTEFSARKSIVVNPEGVLLQPALVEATTQSRLLSVTTDYDWVPLFGSYARDEARKQYATKRQWAERQIESRVESQAGDTLDQQTREAVDRAQKQVWDRFTSGFEEAGIKVTPVEMTTTDKRLVARLRVAGDYQPGSHTPRPRALSDSLASLQVHETALTNAAVTLALDGKRYTAPELQESLRGKFSQMATNNSSAARPDTIINFAESDAVQFRIDKGRVEIIVTLTAVEIDGDVMRDFVVHAYYVPVVDGLNAELVRDGGLGIEGRLRSADRARLHNVFKEVFSPERRLPIVRLSDPNDPRFEDLMVTQLVLEDGWIGLAIGPKTDDRVAERSRSLR